MKRYPRAISLLVSLFTLMLTGLYAQDQGTNQMSRVFAVNLWSSTIDLRLGQDGIFLTSALGPNMASQMVNFRSINPRAIQYKASNSDLWLDTKQAEGKSLAYAIQAGKTYLILVQANGVPGLYELAVADTANPKIVVFNATEQTLPLVQIGLAYNQGIAAAANNLSPGWTNFTDVPAGSYGAFWTYQNMPAGIDYFYTPGRDGKSLGITNFADGGWFAAILWQDNVHKQSGGTIWDISPSR